MLLCVRMKPAGSWCRTRTMIAHLGLRFSAIFLAMAGCTEFSAELPQRPNESKGQALGAGIDASSGRVVEISGGPMFAALPGGKRRFALNIQRTTEGSTVIDMGPWLIRPVESSGPSRLHPKQVIQTRDGVLREVLSNGTQRVIPLGQNLPPALHARQEGLPDPHGARAMVSTLQQGASNLTPSSRTPLQSRQVSKVEGTRRLQELQAGYGEGVRLSPSAIQFVARQANRTATMTFDENVGAVVLLEVRDEAGFGILKKMVYEQIGADHVLSTSETLVRTAKGEQRFVEHHGRVLPSTGGAK